MTGAEVQDLLAILRDLVQVLRVLTLTIAAAAAIGGFLYLWVWRGLRVGRDED